MTTDDEIEQLFQAHGPHIINLDARRATCATRGTFGCLLIPVAAIALFGLLDMQRTDVAIPGASHWLGLPATAVGALFALACLLAGIALWRQWATHNGELMLETDATLVRPFVELLVPGATFSRPKIILSGWHPSLLIVEEEGASGVTPSQIDGSLLGQKVVIVELEDPSSWIVRLDLAFGVAGHLRIRSMARLALGGFWTKGFEKHLTGSRRLGAGHSIDSAPLGAGTGKVVETPLNAVPIKRLLSDALFDHLRAHPNLMVAVAGNTLWVMVPRALKAFQSRVANMADLNTCKEAAKAMRDVHGVLRAILAAGESSKVI